MKNDDRSITVPAQLLSDQLTAINIAAKIREHILNSAKEIKGSTKNTNIIQTDSAHMIKRKGERYEGQ